MKERNPKLKNPKLVPSSKRGIPGYRLMQSDNGYQFQSIFLTVPQLEVLEKVIAIEITRRFNAG